VRKLAVKRILTLIPTSVIGDCWTFFNKVKEQMWRSSKILLPVGIITLGPFMFFIDIWTKTCLVRIYHELLEAHLILMLIEVIGEASISH
jgi:hypothetical protein